MIGESMISYIVSLIGNVFTFLSTHYIVNYKGFQLSFLAAALSLLVARLILSLFFGGVENDDDSD